MTSANGLKVALRRLRIAALDDNMTLVLIWSIISDTSMLLGTHLILTNEIEQRNQNTLIWDRPKMHFNHSYIHYHPHFSTITLVVNGTYSRIHIVSVMLVQSLFGKVFAKDSILVHTIVDPEDLLIVRVTEYYSFRACP